VSDLLTRRQTRFALWCPANPSRPPELVIGQIVNGNPPTFQQLGTNRPLQKATGPAGAIDSLWELSASTLGLTGVYAYHDWFDVAQGRDVGTSSSCHCF
jgi:hypothetical protein